MRILMLSPHPGVRSPLTKHTPMLIEALRELGCDVTSAPWGRHDERETLGRKVSGRLVDTIRMRAAISRGCYDVVVLKTALDWKSLIRDVALAVILRSESQPLVVQLHGGNTEWLAGRGHLLFKLFSRVLFGRVRAVFVLATGQRSEIAALNPKIRVDVVANPFVPLPMPPEIDSTAQAAPVVLFVGRLIEPKGLFEAIQAAALLKADGIAFRLVVAGSGPAAEPARQRVAELGLEEVVTLCGHLEGAKLAGAYASADAFVLPTYHPEGFPTVVAEAMGAGLPLVVTPIRGLTDHLADELNALFVPPKDPRALAAALRRLLQDEHLRTTMGTANREAVAAFAPATVAAQYLDAIVRALRSKD